jgi:hypothetical protein
MVMLLYALNITCWAVLGMADYSSYIRSKAPGAVERAAVRIASLLPALTSQTKTRLAAAAGATIAIPSSLPTAIFALDFGKEGAAVLSAILSGVGFGSSLAYLRLFPPILAAYGWCGVHLSMAALGVIAALAMGAVMFADYRKFSKGYVIRSSLLNESVVTLHACAAPSCSVHPMWRPGARRPWSSDAAAAGTERFWRIHAPTRRCHRCGAKEVVECRVGEEFAELCLQTPLEQCTKWVRESKRLTKPRAGGWDFDDPERYPLAFGDVRPRTSSAASVKS